MDYVTSIYLNNLSFFRLDYTGIALLIIGSFIPCLYYGFYCYPKTKIIYIAMVCVLGLCCISISLWEKFNTPKYRILRAGIYCFTRFTKIYIFSVQYMNFFINIDLCNTQTHTMSYKQSYNIVEVRFQSRGGGGLHLLHVKDAFRVYIIFLFNFVNGKNFTQFAQIALDDKVCG